MDGCNCTQREFVQRRRAEESHLHVLACEPLACPCCGRETYSASLAHLRVCEWCGWDWWPMRPPIPTVLAARAGDG